MNFDNILPNFYRLRFREYLERTESRRDEVRNESASRPLIFADMFLSSDLDGRELPPAPQGIGEMKHGAVADEMVEFPTEPGDVVPEPAPREDGWEAVSAYKFAIGQGAGPNVSRREQLEDEVRRIKALSQPCPYVNEQGMCAIPFIRCGDRHQFAMRESVRQQSRPHPCLYVPGNEGDYVLIADNDVRVREFVKSALELFSDIDEKRIITADSAKKAVDILNRFKQENKRVGLLIIDENMPGMSGFELVNEVYARNHNAEVILMHDPLTNVRKPKDYFGDKFVTPRKRVVHMTLLKPIHSDTLAEAMLEVYPGAKGNS